MVDPSADKQCIQEKQQTVKRLREAQEARILTGEKCKTEWGNKQKKGLLIQSEAS